MQKSKDLRLVPFELIVRQIYFIRDKKVMFDRDLADLYGVETRILNRAVRRNIKRFPEDFMFQLSREELEIWISQFGISKKEKKGLRKAPLVFTEQGVSMLSAVLNSETAIEVSIQIVRIFVKLREILATHKELRDKVEKMERKYDDQFRMIFKVIAQLMKEDAAPKRKIGF
ncbi:MAG: ORF6N domain-containing protein [Candidatus Pacebacteria bacterium]|nr:ORF6N domain-containing protein [Candidatus Paceibacterota bacterium]